MICVFSWDMVAMIFGLYRCSIITRCTRSVLTASLPTLSWRDAVINVLCILEVCIIFVILFNKQWTVVMQGQIWLNFAVNVTVAIWCYLYIHEVSHCRIRQIKSSTEVVVLFLLVHANNCVKHTYNYPLYIIIHVHSRHIFTFRFESSILPIIAKID